MKRLFRLALIGSLILFGLCALLVVVVAIFGPKTPPKTTTTTTSGPQPTLLLEVPTLAPEPPTAAPAAVEPTSAPVAPVPTDTPEAHYVALARAGVTIPSVRPAGVGKGEWTADVTDIGNGPEVTLTMPVGAALDNAQVVRQAKRQLAQVVKAIFDGDPAVVRVTAIGTYADGSDGSELPVASIFVTRDQYTKWDGTADNLGDWRIAPRYQ